MEQPRRIKVKNLIAYGIGDLYGGGSFFLVSTFTIYYLINVVGLSPILAGLVPGLGKVWDAISDPMMGYLTDRTRSRFGRRRVYFLIAIVPVAVSFALIWLPVRFENQAYTFIYYIMSYLFFYTVTTMTMVPYSTIPAEMTTDFRERNRLSGARMIFSILATLTGSLLAQPIINSCGDPARGHLMMGIIFGIFFAAPSIFVFLGTWELPSSHHESDIGMGIFQNFKSILNNRSFRLHIGMYICSYGAMDLLMAWFKFYLIDYLGRFQPVIGSLDMVSIGMGSLVISEVVALPFYIRLANKKGHGRAYLIGVSIWFVAMLLMAFQTPSTPTWFLVANCILIGLGISAGVVIPWMMLPFVTDVDELITTKKRAGTYSGAMTLIRKLIQGAMVIPLLGVLITAIGYIVPTAAQVSQKVIIPQGPETVAWIRMLFIATPSAFMALGLYLALRFKITPESHAILMKEIDRRKSGGSAGDVDGQVKRVCEELTGIEYAKLYKTH